MELLITLLVIIVILIIPVQLAAEWAGARNTDMLSCLVALIFAALIQRGFGILVPGVEQNLGLLITIPLSAIAYMLVLGTGFFKGILIAIAQGILTLLIGFLVTSVLLNLLV